MVKVNLNKTNVLRMLHRDFLGYGYLGKNCFFFIAMCNKFIFCGHVSIILRLLAGTMYTPDTKYLP